MDIGGEGSAWAGGKCEWFDAAAPGMPPGLSSGGMKMPHLFFPTAKKVLQEFQVIAQGRFCHLTK